jgi:uncharacterized protein YcbX
VTERQACSIASVNLHPIKSCGGIAVTEALLIETGLELDRAWMVVDAQGEMITQRERPRLALVKPTLRADDMVLRAPGMLALHIALDAVEAATRARVWDDEVKAYDMGALAAQWFTDFIGQAARLVRFDPEQKRLSDKAWTGDVDAENAFGDGFPLLVTSTASLNELNQRLAAKGLAPVTMERFRANWCSTACRPVTARTNLVLDEIEDLRRDHPRRRAGAPEAGEAVRALQHPERRPGHRRDRPRAR